MNAKHSVSTFLALAMMLAVPTSAQTPGPFVPGQPLSANTLNTEFAEKTDYPSGQAIIIQGDPTGMTDSGAACTAAMAALPSGGGHVKFATKGTYLFTQPCNFGGLFLGQITVDLQGVTINAQGVSAFVRIPPDNNTSQQWANSHINFIGGQIIGNSTPNTYGIQMVSCYACTVQWVEVQKFDTGIEGGFCLNCHFHDVRGFNNLTSFITLEDGGTPQVQQAASATAVSGGSTALNVTITTGTIQVGQGVSGTGVPAGTYIVSQQNGAPGGTGTYITNNPTTLANVAITTQFCTGCTIANSASNNSTVSNARDNASAGQIYQYKIVGSDGIRIMDSVAEGGNPNFSVWFSDHASTTVKNLWIDNMHIENNATIGKIYLTTGTTGGPGQVGGTQAGCCGGYTVTVDRIMYQGLLTATAVGNAPISSTSLTMNAPTGGIIEAGATVTGTGIPASTTVVSQQSGTQGGAGVYTISNATTAAVTNATLTFNPGAAPMIDASSVQGSATIVVGYVYILYGNIWYMGTNQTWRSMELGNGTSDPIAATWWTPSLNAIPGVSAPGTGGTPGPVVLTLAGNGGTPATINATINATGNLASIQSIINPGFFTGTYPVNPAPVTGGGLTGATVNLTNSTQRPQNFLGMSRTPPGNGYQIFGERLYMGTPFADRAGTDGSVFNDTSIYFLGQDGSSNSGNYYGLGTSASGTEWRFMPNVARIGTGGLILSSNAASTANDSRLTGIAQNVLRANNWLQQSGGDLRLNANQNFATATLANINGLSATLIAGRTYRFEANVQVTANAAAGGVQLAVGGTATIANIIYDGYLTNAAGTAAYAQAVALNTAVASAAVAAPLTGFIKGTVTVGATGGTLTIQAAQNTANATATTVAQGSTMTVRDVQ
jgi:hypothetical protein